MGLGPKGARQQSEALHVSDGSEADVAARWSNVRFAPQ